MRCFTLERAEDVSGVSGVGTVAEGIEFGDGRVALRWRGEHASTVVHDSLANVLRIHGHGGRTRVAWASLGARAIDRARARWARLTPREREVAALIVEGLGNAMIARRLGNREATVRNQVTTICEKLEVGTRTQVAVALLPALLAGEAA